MSFTDAGLIDEYRLTVDAILLRGGTPLYNRLEEDHDLRLRETKPYDTGTVLLHYRTMDGAEPNGEEGT
ncbi:hypothetical protein C2R22_22020 (plasmid) [Salinigranum rubrum]|uniref:Bacterial bifunctional deaminase-reductase C-terminal domain-containing protein n=1 Tax=Salinigranum rubrum TaxID=755307 RepID=A0A2I8VQQ1_9EURY|nr:hypothetical protein [Salinigranum rubrum]AUV84235.1 hypothetical protein C2R22_22020 [Salinigranum rubrum]